MAEPNKPETPMPSKAAALFDDCLRLRHAQSAKEEETARLALAIAEELGAQETFGPRGVEYALPACPHCGRITFIGEQLGKVEAYVRGQGRDCAATARIAEYIKQALARRRQS